MKKKLLKGEISTIITLGTLIVLGVSSLASVVFLRKTQTTKTRAAGCAKVENVSYSGDVAAGKTFTCLAVTNGASPYTMACGISKNGGWPYGMQSGSCSGKNCTFSVKMDDQIEAGAVYQLVAFDFRTECGPDKDSAKSITLNVPGTQPQPTQANCDQECCGRPDGFIYQRAIKASCDSNYKGGRYVIIDGVCQGGKRTEKPGCATCRTCQAGARDIAPVPDADLAVNECNSSCEKKDGGNPTPNPNSSTPTQTITPNPNPRVKPTNIPPSTTPSPTGSSEMGGEGQPCIKVYDSASKEHQYYCNEDLVCSEQSERGRCVKPRGGKGQPCKIGVMTDNRLNEIRYNYCDEKNLVCSKPYPTEGICVEATSKSPEEATSIPAQTSTQAATLTQTPTGRCVENNQNVDCPKEYFLECELPGRYGSKGKRYVRRECGQGNNNSCSLSCKTIEDLKEENSYSGDCSRQNTCLARIPLTVIITLDNPEGLWLDAVGVVDKNGIVLNSTRFNCAFPNSLCRRIKDNTATVKLDIKIPIDEKSKTIRPFLNFSDKYYGDRDLATTYGPYQEIQNVIDTYKLSSPIELQIKVGRRINVGN